MFLELQEREDQERRLRIARAALVSVKASAPPRMPLRIPKPAQVNPARSRGIYRDKVSFDGSFVYHIVDHEGRLRFRVEVCAEDNTARTKRWFWRVLDAIDAPVPPAPPIKLVD
jgi:hypothetical protein